MDRRMFLKSSLFVSFSAILPILTSNPALGQNLNFKIRRVYSSSNHTLGELSLNGNFLCFTLELPWLDNENHISRIPEGNYRMKVRYDNTERWEGDTPIDRWRFELLETNNRPQIQMHVGNYRDDTEGCVLLGMTSSIKDGAVYHSKDAFKKLKSTFYDSETPIQTPDVNVSLSILGISDPVTYTLYGTNTGTLTQESHYWTYSHHGFIVKNALEEIRRTPAYITFKNNQIPNLSKYLRWRAAGSIVEGSSSPRGPWQDQVPYTTERHLPYLEL